MRKFLLAGLGLTLLGACAPRGGYYDSGSYNTGYYQTAPVYYAPQQSYYTPPPRYYYTPPPAVVVRPGPVYVAPRYNPRNDCDHNGWGRPRHCRD